MSQAIVRPLAVIPRLLRKSPGSGTSSEVRTHLRCNPDLTRSGLLRDPTQRSQVIRKSFCFPPFFLSLPCRVGGTCFGHQRYQCAVTGLFTSVREVSTSLCSIAPPAMEAWFSKDRSQISI